MTFFIYLQGLYLSIVGFFLTVVIGCALILARKWKNKGKCTCFVYDDLCTLMQDCIKFLHCVGKVWTIYVFTVK